jgi:plasmid stability protein
MTSLTLKDIPPAVHRALKERAERHHRSLNREAIACLEAAVGAERVDVDRLLATARTVRRQFKGQTTAADIRRLRDAGRR